MSGMKKKTNQTLKSTKSGSTIDSTEKPLIAGKITKAKSDSLRLAKAPKAKLFLSSSASGQEPKKKNSSELYPQESKPVKKKRSSKDTSMSELSEADILKLKLVAPDKVSRSQKAKSFRLQNGERQEVAKSEFARRVGRPSKPLNLKEKNHIVRFSDQFLLHLKKRAQLAGFTGWQTYLKTVLAIETGYSECQ